MIRRRLTEEDRLLIQRALGVRPHSYAELQAITGLSHAVMAHHIRTLRAQHIIHVAGWFRESEFGPYSMTFGWGRKPDAARPPALTAAQRMAKTRANRSKT